METFLRRAVAKRRARHTIGITCRSACSNRTVLHLEQCGDRRWRLRRRGGSPTKTIFAGVSTSTAASSLYKSADGGSTWAPVTGGPGAGLLP